MNNIIYEVKKNVAKKKDGFNPVTSENGYSTVTFEFDDDWKQCDIVTANFFVSADDIVKSEAQLLEDMTASFEVPVRLRNTTGKIFCGVVGTYTDENDNIITIGTQIVTLNALWGLKVVEDAPMILYEQIIGLINKIDNNLKRELAGKESLANKVNSKSAVTDPYTQYPSILYLLNHYYDKNGIDAKLELKADLNYVDDALAGKVDNAVGLKYATTNNIDDCTDDQTLYRVYINDSCVSHGYHNLICINQTYRKAQYLFAQEGKILFRVSSKNSDGEWTDWSEWSAVVNDTDLSEALAKKADTATVISACDGEMTFAPYSNFLRAGTRGESSTSGEPGTLNTDIKYRVTSEDIMKFEYDLNVSVDEGFTGYVVAYADGVYQSIYSLGNAQYNYVIPANTEFRLHIRRTTENPDETADINEFVNSVKIQTKIAAEISELKEGQNETNLELANKADNSMLALGCEGMLTFAPYSKFLRAGTRGKESTDGEPGTLNTDIKYRVTSEDIMKFDYDLNVSVDDGFTAYVVKYADGTYESIKSLSDTNGYVIPANTEFRLHIRKNSIEAIENPTDRPTADINEFVSAVKFQTKLSAEVDLKADRTEVDAVSQIISEEVKNITILNRTETHTAKTSVGIRFNFNAGDTYIIEYNSSLSVERILNCLTNSYSSSQIVEEISAPNGATSGTITYTATKSGGEYIVFTSSDKETPDLTITGKITSSLKEKVNIIGNEIGTISNVIKENVYDAYEISGTHGSGYITFPFEFIVGKTYQISFSADKEIDYIYNMKNNSISSSQRAEIIASPNLNSGTVTYTPSAEGGQYIALRCANRDADLTVNGSITFSVADMINSINRKIENIKEGETNDGIPDYYYTDNYLPNKINEIKQNCNILNGITFAFVTDMHFKVNQRQSKKLLKKIMDETNIPFVIFGGDAIYAYGTEEELNEQVAEFNSFKSYVGKNNLFCTRGNHELYNYTSADDKTIHTLTTAYVHDTLFRDTERIVSNMSVKNGCYCIDNEAQRTRIIMLNTSDLSSEPNHEGGGVMFRASTLEWLSGALTEKTDYKIIIVSHTPLNYEKFGNDNSDKYPNYDGLQKMISAFKNKTTFTTTRFDIEVNADFTETTNELICVVSGHRHIDGYSVENNVLNIVTTCDCIDSKDGYGRKAGTISEQAIDIYCINYDTNIIKTVRIGAGESRKFNYSGVVGLCVDYENGTFERLESAVGLSAGSDFNQFTMYGGRQRCNVSDDGTITAYYGDENYAEDGSNGQVMVYQPKFYYKVEPLKLDPIEGGIGYHQRKTNYYVSGAPKSGFKLHPAFYDENGNEVDYILYSAYEGSMYDISAAEYVNDNTNTDTSIETGDLLCSIAGVKPISGLYKKLTKANLELLAQNHGSGWHLETIKATSANQLLMMIELGTMNTQTAVGQGVVSVTDNSSYNCSSLTGSTSSLENKTGMATETINEIGGVQTAYTKNGKVSVTYRGMENPWGNILKQINGVNIWGDGTMFGGQPYIANDFNFDESKRSDNYMPVGFTLPNASGYINAMGYGGEDFDWLLMPSEVGGTYALPVGDYCYVTANLNGYRIARLGGAWHNVSAAGGFCWSGVSSVGDSNRSIVGRLIYVPSA